MKFILCFFLACLSCGIVKAQNSMTKPSLDKQSVLDNILAANNSVSTISCEFYEHLDHHEGEDKDKYCYGHMYYKAPSQFCMSYENSDDKIVVNGKKVHIDHGIFRGTLNTWWSGRARKLRSLMLYSLQGNCELLAQENDYSLEVTEDDDYYVVTIQAEEKKMMTYHIIILSYDKSSYKIQKMHLVAYNDDEEFYDLRNIEYDKGVDDKVFEY